MACKKIYCRHEIQIKFHSIGETIIYFFIIYILKPIVQHKVYILKNITTLNIKKWIISIFIDTLCSLYTLMMLSLYKNIDALLDELSLVIYKKVHELHIKDVHHNINSFLEIQEMWMRVKRIYELCAIDFIDHYIYQITKPFYCLKSHQFVPPPFSVFQKHIDVWMIHILSYKEFDDYVENQLHMLFSFDSNEDVFVPMCLGPYLHMNFYWISLERVRMLYIKYKETIFTKNLKKRGFFLYIKSQYSSIYDSIIDVYHNPELDII